jgi:hypothetical protein
MDEEALEEGGHGRDHQSQQSNNSSNCYFYQKLVHVTNNYYQHEHDIRNKAIMHQQTIKA